MNMRMNIKIRTIKWTFIGTFIRNFRWTKGWILSWTYQNGRKSQAINLDFGDDHIGGSLVSPVSGISRLLSLGLFHKNYIYP